MSWLNTIGDTIINCGIVFLEIYSVKTEGRGASELLSAPIKLMIVVILWNYLVRVSPYALDFGYCRSLWEKRARISTLQAKEFVIIKWTLYCCIDYLHFTIKIARLGRLIVASGKPKYDTIFRNLREKGTSESFRNAFRTHKVDDCGHIAPHIEYHWILEVDVPKFYCRGYARYGFSRFTRKRKVGEFQKCFPYP